jgi:hypothetical protein
MDNFRAHKKALKQLPYKLWRQIRVYWLLTNSSWLNLADSYFATLQRTALNNTGYKIPQEIKEGPLKEYNIST